MLKDKLPKDKRMRERFVRNKFYRRFLIFIKILSIATMLVLTSGFFENEIISITPLSKVSSRYSDIEYFGYPFAWLAQKNGALDIIAPSLIADISILFILGYLFVKIVRRKIFTIS